MTEDLKKQLDKLCNSFRGNPDDSDIIFQSLNKLELSPVERSEAGKYIISVMNDKRKRSDIDVKNIIADIQESANLSYIAKAYFGKDKSWLYHRLNGTLVNDKPAAFNSGELLTLANAFKDMADKYSKASGILISKL